MQSHCARITVIAGNSVDFLPVSLKILYEPPPDGSGRPKLGERKKQNYMGDLRHWAEMVGAEIAREQPAVLATFVHRTYVARIPPPDAHRLIAPFGQ